MSASRPTTSSITLNDTGAKAILFNVDFLPLIEKIRDKLTTVEGFVMMHDRPELPTIDFR